MPFSKPNLEMIYDKETGTMQYIVWCPETKKCAIVDPVLDYDIRHGCNSTDNVDKLLAKVKELGLEVELLLETHVHADHLTASAVLKEMLPGNPPVLIGERVKEVLAHWIPIFDIADDCPADGSQFDRLVKDGDEVKIGNAVFKAIASPGHTPACMTYFNKEADILLAGDTIFNPELGNARADFPGGSAATLFKSARSILTTLPETTKVCVGHCYAETPLIGETIKVHREQNCTLNDRVEEHEFVGANSDKLPVPRLIIPSLQVNLRAGKFGKKSSTGIQYIKIPVDVFFPPDHKKNAPTTAASSSS